MNKNNLFILSAQLFLCSLISCSQSVTNNEPSSHIRPNILWICVEDMSPLFGCYGAISRTPVIDELGRNGVVFQRAFATTAVCSPSRTALITGMMPTSIGTHNHRSYVNDSCWIHLPDGIRTLPQFFQDAKYFTFNQHYDGYPGKEDYNFIYNRDELYGTVPEILPADSSFWQAITSRQPFFGQIQLMGGKVDVPTWDSTFNVEEMKMLPYYPSTPFFTKMYAEHHMQAQRTDAEVGKIIEALKANGLLQNTVIFFFSDHGWKDGIRHKQFCYDGGLHVPLIISWDANPGVIGAGHPRNDMVSLIDVTATSLSLASIPIPGYMEGWDLFAENFTPRKYVIGTRDRMDWTIDHIRTVRTDQYRYICNYMTDRPYLQPQYRDTHAFMIEIRKLYSEGKLDDIQSCFFSQTKPAEEFYDHKNDPHETINKINDPEYSEAIELHRKILNDWILETDDKGQYPETESALEAIYIKWGEKCVNPEYDNIKEEYETRNKLSQTSDIKIKTDL